MPRFPQRQRKHKRQLHQLSKAHLEMMIESAVDYAIFSMDHLGNITAWNRGAERLFGYTEAEIMGKSINIIYTPEDQANGVTESERLIALEKGVSINERWHVRKDGSQLFAYGLVRPMYNNQHKLHGFVKVARDQTERKMLEIAERKQRHLAVALNDTAVAINSTLHLPDVLDLILENLGKVVRYDAASLILIEQDKLAQLCTTGYDQHGFGSLEDAFARFPNPLKDLLQLHSICTMREPLIVPDTADNPEWTNPFAEAGFRSFAGVPIISNDVFFGIISLDCLQPNQFNDEDVAGLKIFATQAAIAIRNAQHHQFSQELAVINERRRLSRDLHDTISQMLLASSMIAEALPRQILQADKLAVSLEKLQRLNKGAHAELRSLLQDLRLSDVSDVSLADLFNQLAQIAMGQTNVTVTVEVENPPALPPAVHEALYRIAQEALNNVVKHAKASEAVVRLVSANDQVTLSITDNGQGFDQVRVTANSMGVGIMQERSNAIRAALTLNSQPGQGTEVQVVWKQG